MAKSYDPKCWDLAKHFYPEATAEQLQECAGDIQDTVENFGEWMNREPPEPDGECYRGNEYASALAHEQARIRRELK